MSDTSENLCFSVDVLRRIARKLEIPLISAIMADNAITYGIYERWVADGKAAGMTYLEEHADARRHPEWVLPGVQTVIMLGFPVETVEKMAILDGHTPPATQWLRKFPPEMSDAEIPPGFGLVAEYAASGIDYHDVIRRRLRTFQKELKCRFPEQISRGIVDTAPFLEREFAERAGIGFIGRNRMLIHPKFGSFLFLAAILTTETLKNEENEENRSPILSEMEQIGKRFSGEDSSGEILRRAILPERENDWRTDFQKMRRACESCGRCLRNCPTGALTAAGVDARKCLSALTVESRGPISAELADKIGIRVLGCDECQRVCPWNRTFLAQRPRTALELAPIFDLSDVDFRKMFAHTPFWRTTREGLVRNAEINRKNQERKA
ncbi:MAG: DUF1730 domain-containing protein [Planctomycetia bacterium]|nr:DUF1730 domain-containing protein [Planctomycetia bacterium]